ncbi:carboxymuconolactone decarboxylase family protein [Fodinibius sediminis]|uniref:Alkylhydroperoxidase AhpD family core domain-containing protein n=1 Tax=Fodinibius sediminis TaxID=1214077 RepID=A0A521CKE4_9BACT|nr:carboxymuconolactone decarboxylase family protein [Fodinibius sediminis]SMO59916.1 alkylhydroperoxidase AhpD family core domain-containing protein [Fodinibius sediminis]
MNFPIYTVDNAPENAQPLLKIAKENFGFVPNLLGEFAEAPAVLEGYLTLNEIVGKTGFSPVEQQLAILAVSIENRCPYCSAIHSTILKNQLNVDEGIVNAVRSGDPVPDDKLNALVTYVTEAVQSRGFVDETALQAFIDAGYSKQNILEINLIIALKTISNYTNHLADTPLDEAFEAEKLNFQTA